MTLGRLTLTFMNVGGKSCRSIVRTHNFPYKNLNQVSIPMSPHLILSLRRWLMDSWNTKNLYQCSPAQALQEIINFVCELLFILYPKRKEKFYYSKNYVQN